MTDTLDHGVMSRRPGFMSAHDSYKGPSFARRLMRFDGDMMPLSHIIFQSESVYPVSCCRIQGKQLSHRGTWYKDFASLNISTGPLALRTFQTAGPVRASTLYLSLALQDHRVKCRASRLKITVARSMTNFATFSCIMFLKFRYVCIAWLL